MNIHAKRLLPVILEFVVVAFVYDSWIHAQSVTTNQLRISFSGDCTNLAELSVVVQGDDGRRARERRVEGHGCDWTVTTTKKFSSELAFFSLRTAGARTECLKADLPKDEVPTLTYACCNDARLRVLTVATDTNVPVSYLREVPKSSDIAGSTPCVEYGNFDPSGKITNVQFNAETIYLQLGRGVANTRLLGLQVNDLPDLQKKSDFPLKRKDIVYRLLVQRAKAKDKSPSSLVPNAIDIDLENLKRIKLEHLDVKVN
jgi:hypothetical protein